MLMANMVDQQWMEGAFCLLVLHPKHYLFVRVPAGQGQQDYRTAPETEMDAFLCKKENRRGEINKGTVNYVLVQDYLERTR